MKGVTSTHNKVRLWEGGPYWADTNIGAEKPWESGYYFWRDDTVGYKYEDGVWMASDGSSSGFVFKEEMAPTSGNSQSALQSKGWTIADEVLAPKHDAAQVRWGGEWRMPTTRELKDLKEKCDWAWAMMNGVNGYVVRGRGGYASASIFLSAAGYGYGTSLNGYGSYGLYWLSVPYSDGGSAWCLRFRSGGHGTEDGYYRSYGCSVRPVQ